MVRCVRIIELVEKLFRLHYKSIFTDVSHHFYIHKYIYIFDGRILQASITRTFGYSQASNING